MLKELQEHGVDGVVFCTGDAEGVDEAVWTVGQANHFQVTKIHSKGRGWEEGFKERNEIIAQYCDYIYSIAESPKKTFCYHCNKTDHEKTAGCWTGKKNGNYEVVILE